MPHIAYLVIFYTKDQVEILDLMPLLLPALEVGKE
jgi:hypothetical protein